MKSVNSLNSEASAIKLYFLIEGELLYLLKGAKVSQAHARRDVYLPTISLPSSIQRYDFADRPKAQGLADLHSVHKVDESDPTHEHGQAAADGGDKE